MTKLEATLILTMRDFGFTWHKIVEIYDDANITQEKWRELCEEAEKVLGVEDFDDE